MLSIQEVQYVLNRNNHITYNLSGIYIGICFHPFMVVLYSSDRTMLYSSGVLHKS